MDEAEAAKFAAKLFSVLEEYRTTRGTKSRKRKVIKSPFPNLIIENLI